MYKIYYANVNDIAEESIFQQKMLEVRTVRKQKVLRCKQKEDQLRSLAGGLLIKHALEEELLPYGELEFEENSNGKVLVNMELYPVWFNLSHSGDFAAVVISNHKVGIDIQQERDIKSRERMIQMCYNDKEKESGKSFCYRWTRKEAYAKMLGLGLKMDFKEIDTTDSSHFWTQRVEGDYWLSIAALHEIKDVEINRISLV